MATDNYSYNTHMESDRSHELDQNNAVHPLALKLLQEFRSHFDLPDLAFDNEGKCQVWLGEQAILLAIDSKSNALVLRCDVIDTPTDANEKFFASLLIGNFTTAFASMGTVAIDPNSGKVFVWQRIPLQGLLAAELGSAIERMAFSASSWRQKLTSQALFESP